MGNASKTGCLGPKRREKDVYAQLIDLIHQQIQVIEFNEPIDPKTLDPYRELGNKIIKKGYIRKLLDHLSSHKSKLSDCISHNFKIITQMQNIKNTYVGLFIVDEIIRDSKQNKNTDYISYEEEDFCPTNPTNPTSNTQIYSKANSFNLEPRGKGAMDIKFEGAYFKFILQLLKCQQMLYRKILESINAFCFTKKQKLTCKAEVSKIIDIIMQHLKLNKFVDESSRTYLNLISLTRQGVKDQYINENYLTLFIKLWLKDQQKSIKSPDVDVKNSQYELIIKQIIFRCISSWNLTKIIFHTLFVFYDQDKFTGFRVFKIETLFLKTIAENDLHYQIFRNLFIYLIEYLSESQINDKKYTKDLTIQNFQHPKYLHISEKTCKIHGFETLRRWQQQGYINLDELISYNCQILVKAYVLNIDCQKQINKQIIHQFLKMNQLISQKSNFMIVNLLLQQIRWDLTLQSLKKTMVTLIRQILQNRKLLQMPLSDFVSFFLPIDHQFTIESRVQLIQLTGYIIRHLNLSSLVNSVESDNISISFCQFFYSIYEGLLVINSDDRISDLFLYTNAINFFLKCFSEKMLFGFVSGFLKSLKNKIIENETNLSTISLYFQLNVFYQGIYVLDTTQQIPDSLISFNAEIINSPKITEFEPKIQMIITDLIASGSSLKNIRNLNKINFQEINKVTNISQKYNKQITSLFDFHFKQTNKQQSINQQLFPCRRSQFYRKSVMNQFYDSIQTKNALELDESFKNMFAGIHDI